MTVFHMNSCTLHIIIKSYLDLIKGYKKTIYLEHSSNALRHFVPIPAESLNLIFNYFLGDGAIDWTELIFNG